MHISTLPDTLNFVADDLRDVKTIIGALPALNAPESVRTAIQNLVNSMLDSSRLVLMKAAICVERHEMEECGE